MTRALLMLVLMFAVSARAATAERVVTLAPHLAELVCAVGGCGKLVGVAKHTDYPAEAAARPQVGDAFAVALEPLLALEPDLVLAWDGGTSPQAIERLRALGLNVRPLAVRRLDDVATALLEIGDALGTAEAARAAAVAYRARLAALRARYGGRRVLRVFYQIEAQPLYTINRQSPISEAIELCGGVNVFADMAALSGVVNPEAVIAADPEVVMFGRQDDVASIRRFWARWPQARAQRAGHLYEIDASLLARQAPRLLDGVEQLCGAMELARREIALGGAIPR